jgi:predicted GTPase
LLEYINEYDQELSVRMEEARQNVEMILQAPNLEEAVQENLEAIDDLFVQAVQVELEQARKDGNLDRSSRLSKIMSVIEEAAKPPAELELVEELMEYVDDEQAMNQVLQEHVDEITPELTQVLTSLIAQGQSVVGETQGKQQIDQQQALESIQKVYEAVLRFSMRRSFMK